MIKNLCPAAIAMFAVASSLVAQTGNQVAIPPHSTIYNGFSRGYGFVANNDFFIQDFELPLDAQQAGDIAGVVVRVNGTQVFYATGGTNAIMTPPAPIQIFTGDIVDVVGNWSPVTTGNFTAHNSYGLSAPFATTIEGVGTTLDRVGVQYDINDPAYATAAYLAPTTGSIGRVWMYTTPPAGLFASFDATPSSGASPLSVTFTDTSFTSDPGGVTSWAWDFDGDGVIDSTNATDTFVYAACGSYDVTLTVTDATNPASTTTVVGAVNVDQVVADFTVAEIAPGTGLWQFTDTSSPMPTSWAWDFDGDGIVDDTNQNPVYFDPNLSPILSLPTCTLTVTGQGGCFSDTLVRDVNVTGYGVANGPMVGGNGTVGTPAVGTYWDISVGIAEGLTINGAECGVYGYAGTADVRIYITPGTHVGNEGNANAWTLAGEGTVTFTGTGTVAAPEFGTVTLNQPFYLPAGDYGVAFYQIDQAGGSMQVSYTNGPANSPYGNADLTIHPNGAGCSSTSELGPCSFSPRLWNGRLLYETCSLSSNASAGTYSNGCANSAGIVPNVAVASMPQLGTNFELDVNTGLAAPAAVVIAIGASKDIYNGLPLPLDLAILGAPGCNLATSADATSLLIANPGAGNIWSFAIPNNPALNCFTFYQQAAVLDIPANAFGFVLSNATAAVVGN